MGRQLVRGMAALALLCLAGVGAAHAQDAGRDYARAMEIVESEPEAAWALLKPLAEAGHPQSMAAVGSMLASGLGVAQDLVASRDWYRRAAEAGAVSGLRGYGGMLLLGEGGPKDTALGIGLLLVAADAGDENAQILLAMVRDDEDPGEEAVLAARDAWLRARMGE